MHKKLLKALVSVVLVLALCSVTCTNAFAASLAKSTYVKEVFLSYGSSDDEAKKYLTDNGYEVVDRNLNEGADDIISKKRSVYLGYKTTDKSDEAITDMKLMNMKGGYSIQDYQMLLTEQKENIKDFLDDFIIAVNEYRNNYKKNQGRAVAAHEMLNYLYEDDTQQYMGDLLLNKIKEEYTDEEWNALSSEEQSKIADMTTILMQSNSDAILIIEQSIALASDDGDSLWIERYADAKTYDEMISDLMSSEKISITEATKRLAAEYDDDAKSIALKFTDYITYLQYYTNAEVSFANTTEEIEAYEKAHEDFDYTNWFAAGTQYVVLSQLMNDDISLLELVTSDEFDIQNEDRCLLYPLVSVLTKGQRACLGLLSMYQLVYCGISGNDAIKESMSKVDFGYLAENKNSIYDGVDRTIFTGDVALTNEALRLQASSGKNAVTSVIDYFSVTSVLLYVGLTVSAIAMTASWSLSPYMTKLAENYSIEANTFENTLTGLERAEEKMKVEMVAPEQITKNHEAQNSAKASMESAQRACDSSKVWSKVFRYAGIAMTCITLILLGLSAWSTYNDLKAYYNAEFTPIPLHMVNQATNDKDEKVYTYYNAVKCNRVAANMVTDSNKLLGDFGDLNGDVGRQWVALYTTTDKAAGNPITTDFVVQYNDTNIPNDTVALSMFGESVAQNLTNKKMGYTYADGKSGIYLFYGTHTSVFAGSVFTNGIYALCGAGALVICAVAVTLIVKANKKKKATKEAEAHA